MKINSLKLQTIKLDFYPNSLTVENGVEYGMAKTPSGDKLIVLAAAENLLPKRLEGDQSEHEGQTLLVCPLSAHNAAALRNQLEWLRPKLLGLQTSAGMGDRLGLATPGHVRSVSKMKGKIAPIFAQQSMREMERSNRTAQQVMDDAVWGIFTEGWTQGFGADADHLKTSADVDICVAAGYTFYTIDPGDHVDNRAETASMSELREIAETLPPDYQPQKSNLADKTVIIEELLVPFNEGTLVKAAVKYGRAIAHVVKMYNHLVQSSGNQSFELEISVDETDQPTTHAEHIYIAVELKRHGVKWISLAPRYIGRFEKGVDYIGDVTLFEADLAGHAEIARKFGPYKLSMHSGSDKFSIYPAVMRQTRGLAHLKTAGTSYLEALRTIAALDPVLFREIYIFARERYETDRATYHVSAELERAPQPDTIEAWTELLNQFDAREILHVTFGSVLTEMNEAGQKCFYERIMTFLRANREIYAHNLEKHFIKHLQPFTSFE